MPAFVFLDSVKAHIDENFLKLKEWIINREKLNECDYNICHECCDKLLHRDEDGYPVANRIVQGRYYPKENKVKFGLSDIQHNVEDIRNGIDKGVIPIPNNMKFDYADMIIFHELAHAYQDKYKKIKLKKDDEEIEQDADEKAIMWYSEYASQQGKSLEAINIIVEYYRKNRGQIK